MNRTQKEVIQYLFLVFLITYSLGIITFAMGGTDAFPLKSIAMSVPPMIILILQFLWRNKTPQNNTLALKLCSWKYWIIAPLTIAVIETVTHSIIYIFYPAVFPSNSEILASANLAVFDIKNAWLSQSLLIASAVNIFLFLGEELGWRSFLTPRLLKLFSPPKAFLFGGLIWGLWHVFDILLGSHSPGQFLWKMLLTILFCIPAGILLQYFHFKSKSVFVAALCRSTLYGTGTIFTHFLIQNETMYMTILAPINIIEITIWWPIGIVFYIKFLKECPNTY